MSPIQSFKRIPPSALPQLYSDFVHLAAACYIAALVGFLAFERVVPADLTGAVFTAVIGYIAGNHRTVTRTVPTRTGETAASATGGDDAAG